GNGRALQRQGLGGRRAGRAVRRGVRGPDLPGVRHPLEGNRPRLPEPLCPRGHGDGLAAESLLRRHRPVAALLDPWRRLPAGHRSLRGRSVPRRAGANRPHGARRRGALAYCLQPATGALL
ncbi:MAG: Iron-sulfur cluster-binding protein, Rieske family, partial [uncultured Ramlibacter sp.]